MCSLLSLFWSISMMGCSKTRLAIGLAGFIDPCAVGSAGSIVKSTSKQRVIETNQRLSYFFGGRFVEANSCSPRTRPAPASC